MFSSHEEDVQTCLSRVSAEHEVAKEKRCHASKFLQNLRDAYEGSGSEFSLDISDDDDDSNAPS
jgi:hypothetical protein